MTELNLERVKKESSHNSASVFSKVYMRLFVPSLVKFFHRFNISPVNFVLMRVTLIPVYLGLFIYNQILFSGLLFYACLLLDHVDGALARAENRLTPLAGFFDDFFDMTGMLTFMGLFIFTYSSSAGILGIVLLSLTYILSYLKLRYVTEQSIRPKLYYDLLSKKIDLSLFFGGEAHRFWLAMSLIFGFVKYYPYYLAPVCALEVINLLSVSIDQVKNKDLWRGRAKTFDEADWVKDKSFLDTLIRISDFSSFDRVLDIGCGTGVVTNEISPLVGEVFGIDTSKSMIEMANKQNCFDNVSYKKMDTRNLEYFSDCFFDKVTARMVFHSILEGRKEALSEIYRVLGVNGILIIGEVVPQTSECKSLLQKILSLKEKRVTFNPIDIKKMMEQAGFEVKMETGQLRGLSTKKWLKSNNLPNDISAKMMEMYQNSPSFFKEAYNMIVTDDDAIVDCKFVIAVGMKK